MEEWKIYKLKEIGEIVGGATPSTKNPSNYDGPIPWITPKDLSNSNERYIFNGERSITNDGYMSCSCKLLPKGTVLFSSRAPIGYVAIAAAPMCTNQGFKSFIPNSKVDSLFMFYLMKYRKDDIANLGSGTTFIEVSGSVMKEFEVKVPNLDTQKRIANVLSSLDDKIELNNRINHNLEQQASSLLSDWISTYPCRTYKLSDICKYANAKCETGNLTPQNYISTENMLPNKKGIVEASNIPTGKATCYKVDDILIANIRPYFQKIWKADINGGCSADVLCIRANIESHSPILYWLLHQDAFFEYVMTGAKGCKMPRGDKQHIMNWSIDLPEVQYWADLATQLGSIDQQIAYNRIESINLSNLRDTLLPKLMSGEIKINEIDC